jgi:hypothetical protein
MVGDGHVEDSSAVVREDDEHEQEPVGDGGYHEESAAMIWLAWLAKKSATTARVARVAAACTWQRSTD